MTLGGARTRYLFDLDACLEWWIPAATSVTRDRSAIDAAHEIMASSRNRRAECSPAASGTSDRSAIDAALEVASRRRRINAR